MHSGFAKRRSGLRDHFLVGRDGTGRLPRDIIRRLNALTKQTLESPSLKRRCEESGASIRYTMPEGLAEFHAVDQSNFAPLIRASGARVD